MNKDKRYQKTGGYIETIKKKVHAGIIHNKALKAENERLREGIHKVLTGEDDLKRLEQIELEPDWDKHWQKTWAEVKELTSEELDARVAQAKLDAKAMKPPTEPTQVVP